MQNLDAATTAAEKALAAVERTRDIAIKAKLQIQLADILGLEGKLPESLRLFDEAIVSAERAGDTAMVAAALDRLGITCRKHRLFAQSDRAITEAFRLRKMFGLRELEWSYMNLAELRADQGDLKSALVLMNAAMAGLRTSNTTNPLWSFYFARGKIYAQRGELSEALTDLRIALKLANELDVVPSDENRVFLEGDLEPIHAALIDAGTRLYLQNGDASLIAETFDAAESNRAASLRALLPQPNDWRQRLSPRYWEILPKLQNAEQEQYRKDTSEIRDQVRRLRTELSELEASAGLEQGPSSRDALAHARRFLTPDTVLFSFSLGETNSWVWSVTRSQIGLHRLPPRGQISGDVQRFAAAVRTNAPQAQTLGRALYNELFPGARQDFPNQNRWLLALDEALFSAPFAALISGDKNGRPIYLAQQRLIEITTGAMMLSHRPPDTLAGDFLGIGDPIYNTADQRWHRSGPAPVGTAFAFNLERLAGSRKEIVECARDWNALGGHSAVLLGAEANKARLNAALRLQPSVIHFATHFVKSPQRFEPGLIALSLSAQGAPELLGADEIVLHPVPARLVVLSGCNSGGARALPASGLMGLTRAWIGAGSSAVLATQWDTPDDSGIFLQSFYRYLLSAPQGGPAVALYNARLEMLRSGTWRANPSYWASYFLVGNS